MTDDIDPALVERCKRELRHSIGGDKEAVEAVLRSAGVPEMIAALELAQPYVAKSIWEGDRLVLAASKDHARIDAALKKAKGGRVMPDIPMLTGTLGGERRRKWWRDRHREQTARIAELERQLAEATPMADDLPAYRELLSGFVVMNHERDEARARVARLEGALMELLTLHAPGSMASDPTPAGRARAALAQESGGENEAAGVPEMISALENLQDLLLEFTCVCDLPLCADHINFEACKHYKACLALFSVDAALKKAKGG